ncbi:DUF6470 family protein [Paenibacillus sp. KQZ6P-2]|uniref:DUF6470 family protein n=1 Tax=Paenibacillus mangrovi TaxID=2931978 RepID=A0A9X1WQC4_9BACL|nr:DUF6470 family protein [Paenibacillus mangrovi]MCJ8012756.1 DUF6470 family protein [Paenibacillus mangrovi]
MNLQRLSIRQTYANIGMESERAQLMIESPPAEMDIESSPSMMDIQKTPSELSVDSSRAWMALGKGDHLEWLHMISSQMHQQYLTNVANIVDEGNRLAQFTKQKIADMIVQRIQEKSIIEYNGEASSNNVDVKYKPAETNINWNSPQINITFTPNRPNVSFQPGSMNIYLKNKNDIKMWVSNYDLYG